MQLEIHLLAKQDLQWRMVRRVEAGISIICGNSQFNPIQSIIEDSRRQRGAGNSNHVASAGQKMRLKAVAALDQEPHLIVSGNGTIFKV